MTQDIFFSLRRLEFADLVLAQRVAETGGIRRAARGLKVGRPVTLL